MDITCPHCLNIWNSYEHELNTYYGRTSFGQCPCKKMQIYNNRFDMMVSYIDIPALRGIYVVKHIVHSTQTIVVDLSSHCDFKPINLTLEEFTQEINNQIYKIKYTAIL